MAIATKKQIAAQKEREARFLALYNGLNAEQKEAVDTIEGPVMVLAGPGTGKTQVLTMRIAAILRLTHMDPWNILCLTFTESGVAAMRERLARVIGSAAYGVRIHTFHSFCNEVIQEHPDVFAKSYDWQPLTDVERITIFQEIIDGLPGTSPLKPFGNSYLYLRDCVSHVQALKQEDISPDSFGRTLACMQGFITSVADSVGAFCGIPASRRTDSDCERMYRCLRDGARNTELPESLQLVIGSQWERYQERSSASEGKREHQKAMTAYKDAVKKWFEKMARDLPRQMELRNVYEMYSSALEKKGRYDYEDMIVMVVDQFRQNDALLAQYQEQFQYMLVDEYQDTNGAQNEVIALLGSFGEQPNIFVVGDDKQSIYRFQGASLSNMLDFYTRYKEDVRTISLRQNYRSQTNVLRASGSVISHNEESIGKYIPGVISDLHAASGRIPEPIQEHVFVSEDEENAWIVQRIAKLVASGEDPSGIAVLSRYNRDAEGLLELLRKEDIPARLEAGEDVLRDGVVNRFLRMLVFLSDTRRDDLFSDIMQYEWWGIDALDALQVIHFAGGRRKDLLRVVANESLLREAGVKNTKPFLDLVNMVSKWRKAQANMALQQLLHDVLTESGLLDFIVRRPDHVEALQKISTLLNEAKNVSRSNKELTLQEFIDYIGLLRHHNMPLIMEPWRSFENGVRLMTAHKSKGLEFEHVFITRFNDKHWGNARDRSRLALPHGLVRYDMVMAGDNNEDERRLFYVAITRAKQRVYITRAKHARSGKETAPSVFDGELPEEVTERAAHRESSEEAASRLVQQVKPVPAFGHKDVERWLKEILRGYVMSVTHLNNYLSCPRMFYSRNILRIPSVRTKHQALGTAIHESLTQFFTTFQKEGSLPPKKELLASFEKHVFREVLSDTEERDVLAIGARMLQEYYDHYHTGFVRQSMSEYDFRSHNVRLGDVPVTGKLDKIELVDESDVAVDGAWRRGAKVHVIDYKTGNPDTGMRKMKRGEDYYRQLVFYKALCDASPQFPYAMVSGEVDFLQPSPKKGFIKKIISVSSQDVEVLTNELVSVWEEIQSLAFLQEGAGCGKKDCEYCVL